MGWAARELGNLMRDMGERLSIGETAAYFKSLDSNQDNVVDFAELYVFPRGPEREKES